MSQSQLETTADEREVDDCVHYIGFAEIVLQPASPTPNAPRRRVRFQDVDEATLDE